MVINSPCKNCKFYNSNATMFINDGKAFCDNWHCVISNAVEKRIENLFQYNKDCFLENKE